MSSGVDCFPDPLSLGDRHGENILVDTTNGDVVHVDFNCLFGMVSGFPKHPHAREANVDCVPTPST